MVLLFPPAEPFGASAPHPPQCAHWGTFPPGEGIALRNPYKHQFIGQLNKADKHIRKYETEMRKRYASY